MIDWALYKYFYYNIFIIVTAAWSNVSQRSRVVVVGTNMSDEDEVYLAS